jgi:predicted dehydrogenase
MAEGVVGLGFVGVGLLGQSMIEQVANVPTLRVVALQDANYDLAKQVAALNGGPWSGQDLGALLAFPAVDAVVISTPNVFHIPQTQMALQLDKDVLVQKPLATRAADARSTAALAADRRRILFVDYSYRLLETAAAFRAAIPEVGPVRSLSAEFHNVHGPRPGRDWFFDPALSGGGALTDLGVHLLDFMLAAIRPVEVRLDRANLERRPGLQVEHYARADIHFDDIPVHLEVSWDYPHPLSEINVVVEGANQTLRWHNVKGSFGHFRTELGERLLIDREISLRLNTLRAFAAAIATGSSEPFDTRVYDLLDRAYDRA